ncbi:MAG: hypothetical protein AB7K09_08275 [Planctomycetota bacterium]
MPSTATADRTVGAAPPDWMWRNARGRLCVRAWPGIESSWPASILLGLSLLGLVAFVAYLRVPVQLKGLFLAIVCGIGLLVVLWQRRPVSLRIDPARRLVSVGLAFVGFDAIQRLVLAPWRNGSAIDLRTTKGQSMVLATGPPRELALVARELAQQLGTMLHDLWSDRVMPPGAVWTPLRKSPRPALPRPTTPPRGLSEESDPRASSVEFVCRLRPRLRRTTVAQAVMWSGIGVMVCGIVMLAIANNAWRHSMPPIVIAGGLLDLVGIFMLAFGALIFPPMTDCGVARIDADMLRVDGDATRMSRDEIIGMESDHGCLRLFTIRASVTIRLARIDQADWLYRRLDYWLHPATLRPEL